MTEEQASIFIEQMNLLIEYADANNAILVKLNDYLLIIGFLLMLYFGINIGRFLFGR